MCACVCVLKFFVCFLLVFCFCCWCCCCLFLSCTNDDGHSHYNNFQLKEKCQYSPKKKSMFSCSNESVREKSLAREKRLSRRNCWEKLHSNKRKSKGNEGKEFVIQLKRNRNENRERIVWALRENSRGSRAVVVNTRVSWVESENFLQPKALRSEFIHELNGYTHTHSNAIKWFKPSQK